MNKLVILTLYKEIKGLFVNFFILFSFTISFYNNYKYFSKLSFKKINLFFR